MKGLILSLLLGTVFGGPREGGKYKSFSPGTLWYDEQDSLINAHGGGMLYEGGTYYWFGERRGQHRSEGVSVYSSKDLYNWKAEGLALAPSMTDTASDIASGCVMERPKVLYNKATKKYVMWFHLELRGQGYRAARAGVAESDKVTGPYRFVGSFRPNGNMFRDMTLYEDGDGVAYAIYASRDNYDLRMVRLSADYLSATAQDSLLFSKQREAPAIFKSGGRYYLYTSACTGWRPNKASLHVASSVWGPWREVGGDVMGGMGADSTFGGQPAFVLAVGDKFVFVGDRWNPRDLRDSRYLFLPVVMRGGGPFVGWKDEWRLGENEVHSFALGDSVFLLDGKEFQMISGEMHYTRVPREAWRQRMRMAKAMGLNTIGTYVFWNVHEPEKGKFDFSGNNDIAAFVRTAQEEGLWVILRPSPYVCAEWEFGGYPYWLQNERELVVRSKEKRYLEEYRKYILEVGKQLAPLQVNHGGNILMVQIENEYGSYGSDKEYLEINRRLFVEAGFDGLLYTCDPAPDVAKGSLSGLLPAVNGVDKPAVVRDLVRKNHGGKGPFYIAEWYPAWFDWWGTKHHTVPAEEYVHRLDSVLGAGISINMYMFHGGTTRGFMNGANYNDRNPYEPQISSYDYDAPLDEAGNATEKYMRFREVIASHLPAGVSLPAVPAAKVSVGFSGVKWSSFASVFDALPAAVKSDTPLTFEDLNQAYGFVLYRSHVKGSGVLKIEGLRDYAVVYVDGKKAGVLDRRLRQDSLVIHGGRLDILVENLGRINFGPYLLKNKKGIVSPVLFGGKVVKGWEMYGLPMKEAPLARGSGPVAASAPVGRRGTFNLEKLGDTYLDMRGWGKGSVWVNGHHLGRYWEVGPQQTVYVPVEWVRKGTNEIVIFELLKPEQTVLNGVEKPVLSELK